MLRIAFLLLLAFDVNGRWWGTATLDGHASQIYLTFIREGDSLRGTGGPTKVDQDLLQGQVQGGHFVFDVLPGGRTPLHFNLTPDGERLTGTVSIRRGGQSVSGSVSLRKRTTD